MQLSPAALDAMYYSFSRIWQTAFNEAQPWWTKLATKVPSTTRENRYPWMASLPRMREWIGERILRNVSARSTSLINKPWEDSVEVDRDDIEDDNLGMYNGLVQMLGVQAKMWPDDMLATVLKSTTDVAWDGQPFFNASHPVNVDNSGSGTWSNLFTSTALTIANAAAVRASMKTYQGEDGRNLSVDPRLLIVPPQLEVRAREIATANLMVVNGGSGGAGAAAVDNVMKGMYDVLVVPELSDDATRWFLADVSKPIKPFVVQIRKEPTLVALTDPHLENVFMRRKFIYGVDSRGNAGFGPPFLIAKATA